MVLKKKMKAEVPPSHLLDMPGLIEKATSDLLDAPDLGMNLTICDFLNCNPGYARDVVKSIKKRMGNKNSKVQLLVLTILEMIMKNCGEVVHQAVAEKGIVHDMVKTVKKKADMAVRENILLLLDSWQEAFGGVSGKYPQFYMACDELRRFGIAFPKRKLESIVPILTPPATHPNLSSHSRLGSQAERLNVMAGTTVEDPIWQDVNGIRGKLEVLNEMLNALETSDKQEFRDDLIVQLVEQCWIDQRSIQQLATSTTDETLLFQILSVNDDVQQALQKYDAITLNFQIDEHTMRSISITTDNDDETVDHCQLDHRSRSKSGGNLAYNKGHRLISEHTLPPVLSMQNLNITRNYVIDHVNYDDDKAVSPMEGMPSTSSSSSSSSQYISDIFMMDSASPQYYSPSSMQKSIPPTAQYSVLIDGEGHKSDKTASTIDPSLPPPPIRHTERERFFEERRQTNHKRQTFSPSPSALEKREKEQNLECYNRHTSSSLSGSQTKKTASFEEESCAKGGLFEGLVDFKTISNSLPIPNTRKGDM